MILKETNWQEQPIARSIPELSATPPNLQDLISVPTLHPFACQPLLGSRNEEVEYYQFDTPAYILIWNRKKNEQLVLFFRFLNRIIFSQQFKTNISTSNLIQTCFSSFNCSHLSFTLITLSNTGINGLLCSYLGYSNNYYINYKITKFWFKIYCVFNLLVIKSNP